MRRYVFLVGLLVALVVGCAGTGTKLMNGASLAWMLIDQEGEWQQQTLSPKFRQVPTHLEGVEYFPNVTRTDFELRPNKWQSCGCRTQGPIVVCVCDQPTMGLCLETGA